MSLVREVLMRRKERVLILTAQRDLRDRGLWKKKSGKSSFG